MTFWSKNIIKWKELVLSKKVNIRLLPTDIVSDFFTLHSLKTSGASQEEETSTSNTSLPGSILRIYQKHPALRSSPHESKIDFTLSRQLQNITGRPDWVIPDEIVEKIITETAPYNRELESILDPGQVEQMNDDLRWWDSTAFKKPVKSAEYRDISADEADMLIYESLSALHSAEMKIVSLRNQIRKLRLQIETA